MSSRIERLRELLEEPLLITNPVNVLYLTGLDSSNVALLVEPERVRLFTDFRYIESAQGVQGVEAVQTRRSLIGWLSQNLSGRIGFESNVLPWSFAEQLREGGLELVPRRGLVEQLRAVKDEGELVVIDAGCRVDGYVSDYTRTLATGELDGEMRDAYDVVLAAQQAGLDAIRAGLSGVEVDAAARDVIEGSDFAGTFGHGLGHGLGLDVHESPRLSTESSDTLAAGNVLTVEPGVYLAGRFGIRIEDDVIVTHDGLENPVRFTKELLTVS